MVNKAGQQHGFTIVEIIIVIMVIAVLTVIGLVSYSNIKQGSDNSARSAAAKDAILVIKNLLTQKKPSEIRSTLNYKADEDWYTACIGTGYKDANGDGIGDCGVFATDPPYASQSTAFVNLLQSVGRVPNLSTYPASKSTDGDVVSGPYLQSVWVGKVILAVEYSLQGEGRDCQQSPLVYRTPPEYTVRTLTPPSGAAAKYTRSVAGITDCVVVVADNYY